MGRPTIDLTGIEISRLMVLGRDFSKIELEDLL